MATKKEPILQISRRTKIGAQTAENDEFLHQYFVENDAFVEVEDVNSPVNIVIGRTGTGKTAIIKRLEEEKGSLAIRVRPEDVAFEHLMNSSILGFLAKNGFYLSKFFEIVWRHAFLVEVIRQVGHTQSLWQQFKNRRTEPEQALLSDYQDRYMNGIWEEQSISLHEVSKSIQGQIATEIKAQTGIAIVDVGGSVQGQVEGLLNHKEIIEKQIVHAVPASLLRQQSKILDILKDEYKGSGKVLYLLVDELDENWAQDELRVQLIEALLNTLKKFRTLQRLKICVVIRQDLFERVRGSSNSDLMQFEKLKDSIADLTWSPNDLKSLVDRRIAFTFKDHYGGRIVSFGDVFPERMPGYSSSFDYMIKRTLLRPRDIISFINECLRQSDGDNRVKAGSIQTAEKVYSRERIQGLVAEWSVTRPYVENILKSLTGAKRSFRFREFKNFDKVRALPAEIWSMQDKLVSRHGSLLSLAELAEESERDLEIFCKTIAVELFEIGVIDIKISSQAPYQSSYQDLVTTIGPDSLDDESLLKISAMFWSGLAIRGPSE